MYFYHVPCALSWLCVLLSQSNMRESVWRERKGGRKVDSSSMRLRRSWCLLSLPSSLPLFPLTVFDDPMFVRPKGRGRGAVHLAGVSSASGWSQQCGWRRVTRDRGKGGAVSIWKKAQVGESSVGLVRGALRGSESSNLKFWLKRE